MSETEPPLGGATTAVAGESPSQPGKPVLAASWPAPIGRFIILETLGAGGMGVVYAAYDPTLDRRIAVKLMRLPLDGSPDDAERERMLREARALAKLDHPSILTVHDAGLVDGQVFIATELAGGGTLRAWQEETKRARAELLAAYVAAARGLAAAHDAGLVHRDFKPDNVLRTADGRIRVADFGLVGAIRGAASGAAAPGAAPADAGDGAVHDSLGAPPGPSELTITGTILGTPRYMSPEQHRGDRAGPAADQFAFCVSLWEALTGKAPFTGGRRQDIYAAIAAGPPAPPADVPAWLIAVLTRGMARDPAARWPSMHALIAALLDDPVARRRRRMRRAGLIALIAGSAALIVVLAVRGPRAAAATCDGGSPALDRAWSPERADGIRRAFAASALPYAPAIADRLVAAVDDQVLRLREARRAACRATRITGEQSDAMLDRRSSCLDRRIGELDALVGALGAVQPGDRRLIDGALDAIAALPALDSCADVARLAELTPLPADPAARSRIEQMYRRIAAPAPGRPLYHTRETRQAAYETLRALEPEVAALQHPPLATALAMRLADVAPVGPAEGHLRDALRHAAAAGDDGAIAEAWEELIWTVGAGLHRHGEAELLRAAAEAAALRAGRAPDDDFELLDALAQIANDRGDYTGARDLAARALAAAERIMRPGDPRLGTFVVNLASAERFAGNLDTALTVQRRAVALHTAALGADHPDTIYDHVLIATFLTMLGRSDEAVAIAEPLRARAMRVLGDAHPITGGAHMAAGDALAQLGRHDEALAAQQASLSVLERALGPEHTEVVNARSQVANQLSDLGRHDEALVLHRAVLASHERSLGVEHPRVAQALLDLGQGLMQAGRFDEARPLLDRAVKLGETSLGPEHPMLLGMVGARAKADLYADRVAEALPWIERAIALADETLGIDHPRASQARYDLVLARWELGRRDEARALARELIARGKAGGGEAQQFAAFVESWLAAHR